MPMDKTPIPKSQKAFEYKFKVFTIAYGALGLFVTIMIFNLSRSLNIDEFIDLLLATIVLLGLYLIFATSFWYQWQGTKYYITPHALIVKNRTKGLFPSYSEQIYTLNNISSANITKSGYAERNNYGDITLTLQPGNQQVILSDIDNPQTLSSNLSKSIGITTMREKSSI
jgi:hypothetical protein